jgi:hypothetical protein
VYLPKDEKLDGVHGRDARADIYLCYFSVSLGLPRVRPCN